MKTCLFNTCSDNVAGYCKLHHCSLTVKQIKAKECLKKQCWHLQKNEAHDWWRQRDVMKQKRKAKRSSVAEGVC